MLTPVRASSSVFAWGAVVLTAALIVLRSFVFLQYEQADFDADQAIVGLMALHFAEGRAWPLFFYGQLYMMAVQAWMAAPVFLVWGASVFTLKLPLVGVNLLTGGLLLWLLRRESGLWPWQAVVASSWFALLPPVTASRMVQAQGGTIEPLLYTLVLWLLRRRAVAFGVLFAFGFLQREFTLFAVVAIVAVEAWTGTLRSRQRVAHWLVVLLVFLGARQAVGTIRHSASMFGPDAAPPRIEDGVTNVDLVVRSVCPAPEHVLGNLWWLARNNVPTFFGLQTQPPGALILSGQPTGSAWAGVPAVAALALAVLVMIRGRRYWWPAPPAPDSPVVFPLMLTLTGALSVVGVATGCDVRSLMTLRYHLLLAFAPVGLTAAAFVVANRTTRQAPVGPVAAPPTGASRAGGGLALAMMTVAVIAWMGSMLWQHARLIQEYRASPPPSAFRELADDLATHGDRYGWASYWVAYHVDFLSRERVQLSPTSAIRINEYARQALKAGQDAVTVGSEPCAADEHARRVAGWLVCRPMPGTPPHRGRTPNTPDRR